MPSPEILEAFRRVQDDPALADLHAAMARLESRIFTAMRVPGSVLVPPLPGSERTVFTVWEPPTYRLAPELLEEDRLAREQEAIAQRVETRRRRQEAIDNESWAKIEHLEEYLAWRREPRIDPAAGPEAHALEPTCGQFLRFKAWTVLLFKRHDMPGIGIHEDGSE